MIKTEAAVVEKTPIEASIVVTLIKEEDMSEEKAIKTEADVAEKTEEAEKKLVEEKSSRGVPVGGVQQSTSKSPKKKKKQ